MLVSGGGGGEVRATYGPMDSMSTQLHATAQQWSSTFTTKLTTCGNPTLDDAINGLGGTFSAATTKLSGATAQTSSFVCTVSGNFRSADGGS